MTLGLEWTGQETFVSQPLKEWKVDGEIAGLTRNAGPLTFLTLDGAGHMVRNVLRMCSTKTHALVRRSRSISQSSLWRWSSAGWLAISSSVAYV